MTNLSPNTDQLKKMFQNKEAGFGFRPASAKRTFQPSQPATRKIMQLVKSFGGVLLAAIPTYLLIRSAITYPQLMAGTPSTQTVQLASAEDEELIRQIFDKDSKTTKATDDCGCNSPPKPPSWWVDTPTDQGKTT